MLYLQEKRIDVCRQIVFKKGEGIMTNDQNRPPENEKAKQEENLEDRIMKEIKEHPDRNHFLSI